MTRSHAGSVVLLLGIALVAQHSRAAIAADQTPEELYKQATRSIATLTVKTKSGTTVTGTAFLAIKDGLAVTALHVVNNAAQVSAKFADGDEFEVSGLVDKDVRRDLAVVKVKVFGRPLLPLDNGDVAVGTKAYVIGAPRGLEFSISDGIVSQVRQESGARRIQFTCPVSPGNSGGPLLNAAGKVIGVVSYQRGDGQNLNFAYPVSYAQGLDTSLPTTPWASLAATPAATTNTVTPADPQAPARAQGIKLPPMKRNTIKLRVPKSDPYTLLIPRYQVPDIATIEVSIGKESLRRVESPVPAKGEFSVSSLGVVTVNEAAKGKEALVSAAYQPHRVAVAVDTDPSPGDLQDALKKQLQTWGDEVVAGAEVVASVEKIRLENGGARQLANQLKCDRIVVGLTSTTSTYTAAGLGSYYTLTTTVRLVMYDLISGDKILDQANTVTGRSNALEGQRGTRQDLVKGCVKTLLDGLTGIRAQ